MNPIALEYIVSYVTMKEICLEKKMKHENNIFFIFTFLNIVALHDNDQLVRNPATQLYDKIVILKFSSTC